MQFSVVQIENESEGQPRKAMLAAFGAELARMLYCVVVDEDVDIHDPRDVIWAISTRCRPDRDITLIPGVPSAARDAHQTYWGRMGIDATKPLKWRDAFERRIIPAPSHCGWRST
ncbi:MAG: UbiD family decarboxylase [Candidatus Rokubacteria bacterium]|nr:UbiD family decarboxylase [Candidatus Rokubacteria bacterium]